MPLVISACLEWTAHDLTVTTPRTPNLGVTMDDRPVTEVDVRPGIIVRKEPKFRYLVLPERML